LFKLLLLSLVSINLFALDISMSRAKLNHESYSTLNLKADEPFLCQEFKNEEKQVTKIICAFDKEPSDNFRNIQNDFFKIDSQLKKKSFFITITPFHKIKLFPVIFNLTNEPSLFLANIETSKHWMILGYKNKEPLIKTEKHTDIQINFPFYLDEDKLPYVGALDIKGYPINMTKSKDVNKYLKVKKLYKNKQYDEVLGLIDEINEDYPNSIFNAELLYLKIKTNNKLNDNDNLIENSKIFLQEYSSDENIPEVLALIARAYSRIGLNVDADYFFDRLFTEHENSKYISLGYIFKGEMSELSGDTKKAVKLYKKALYKTTDIEVATMSAYKLAQYYMNVSKKDETSKYVKKIALAMPSYFMKDLKTSMELMYYLELVENYESASIISESILNEIDKNHDEYERLLKDTAVWLAKTNNKTKALKFLNRYIKEYPYGDYLDDVETAKDSLFFDFNEDNKTVQIERYNELIEKYVDDSIGNRALYEKAKLLLKEKRYDDILAIRDSLVELDKDIYGDVDNIIKESATGKMKLALENNRCKDVLKISSEHNITLSNKWDDGVYKCGMKGGDYQLAKKIANRNLKSKDLELRKKWLYRYIKIDFATGNYTDVIEASKELITLIKDDENSKYNDVYRYLFDTYHRVEKTDEMIQLISELENIYGLDYEDIERYVVVMNIGSKLKDDNMVIKYGSQVEKIQNSSKSYVQSPFIEFTLYQAYVNKEEFNKALKVIKSLDSVDISKKDRARQKYLLGTAYSNLWREDEAQKAYGESVEADFESPWAKLAKGAMEL